MQTTEINWGKHSVLGVIGTVGAQAFSLLAITRILLLHYARFTYHISALKSLYFEQESGVPHIKDGKKWRRDLKNQFENRGSFDFSYWSQSGASLLNCCCCCLIRSWKKDKKGWYSKQMDRKAKFELAREKFGSEIDLQSILTM